MSGGRVPIEDHVAMTVAKKEHDQGGGERGMRADDGLATKRRGVARISATLQPGGDTGVVGDGEVLLPAKLEHATNVVLVGHVAFV